MIGFFRRYFRLEEVILLLFVGILFALRIKAGLYPIPKASYFLPIINLLFVTYFSLICFSMYFRMIEDMMSRLSDTDLHNFLYLRDYLKYPKKIVLFLRDFMPFFLIFVLYEGLGDGWDLVHRLNPNDMDWLLIKADEFLFGFHASKIFENFMSPVLTDLMFFAYSLHFVIPPVCGAVFYIKGKQHEFRDFMVGIVLINCIGFLGYIVVPAVGPNYYLVYNTPLEKTDFSRSVQEVKAMLDSTPRNAFPGLHIGLSAVVLLFAYKFNRKLFYIILPFVILLGISTLYIREHYLIDNVAGLFLALFCVLISPKINRWWYGGVEYS